MNRRSSVAALGLVLFTLSSPALADEKGASKATSTKTAKPAKPTNATSAPADKPAAKPAKKAKTPKGAKAKPGDAAGAGEEAKQPAPGPETPPVVAAPAEEAKPAEEPKPAAEAPAPPPAPEAVKVEEPKVFLHVVSDSPVTIEKDTGEAVCTSPCDQLVPAASLYRVGGQRPSKPFVLDGKNGHAKINVDPATNREFYTGLGVLGGGGALAIAGGIVTAVAYGMRDNGVAGASGSETDTSYTDGMTAGVVMMVAGVAAGIWGGATMLSNRESSVSGQVQKAPPARGEAPSNLTKAAGLSGPTFFMPILGGTF